MGMLPSWMEITAEFAAAIAAVLVVLAWTLSNTPLLEFNFMQLKMYNCFYYILLHI